MHSFSIATDHVLHVLDLPLLQGTLARVSLAWDIPDITDATASVQGRPFSSVSDVYSKTASIYDVTRDKPLTYAVLRTGAYALVLELPGDETPVNANLVDPGSFDDVGVPAQRTIDVSVKVTVCPRAPAKPANFRTPAGGTDRAPDAFVITGTVNTGNAQLTWPTEGAARWELFYNKESFASPLIVQSGADQGASPITLSMANFAGTVAVTGLPRGYWVSFAA